MPARTPPPSAPASARRSPSQGADAAVLTAPASIAWLFNIRGGDVIRSPLPLGQAILRADGTARLFLDPAKVTADLPGLARQPGQRWKRPTTCPPPLAELKGKRVLVDPAQSLGLVLRRPGRRRAPRWSAAVDPCALPARLQERRRDRGHAQAPTAATARP